MSSCSSSFETIDHSADTRDAGIAKALTLDEARRIASNIAKLPDLTCKEGLEASASAGDFLQIIVWSSWNPSP
jgi:hypothetical protein